MFQSTSTPVHQPVPLPSTSSNTAQYPQAQSPAHPVLNRPYPSTYMHQPFITGPPQNAPVFYPTAPANLATYHPYIGPWSHPPPNVYFPLQGEFIPSDINPSGSYHSDLPPQNHPSGYPPPHV